ncbi:hypothetical protein [Cupriavidus sp. M-11]|uniref:hypothetical protein n=1 Tax=Cupriavidus sp. M-11 TaxID=3233038 RepID=UPI003F8F38FA
MEQGGTVLIPLAQRRFSTTSVDYLTPGDEDLMRVHPELVRGDRGLSFAIDRMRRQARMWPGLPGSGDS